MRLRFVRRVRQSAPACGAVALIGLGAATSGAANLLINPGFESPAAAGSESTTVTGWSLYSTAERATFQNHTPAGSWSLWERAFEPLGGVTQVVNSITGGTNYTFSAFYFFEANYPASGATADLKLTWSDNSVSVLNILPNTVTTGAWSQYTLNATAPAGATSVTVSLDWFNGSNVGGAQSAFADDGDLEGAGIPPTIAAWALSTSGDWNIAGDWSTGNIPNGIGQEADFFGAITAAHNVFTDTAVTAGLLNFNNANTYVIDGAGSLTLQTSSGNAQIIVQQGTQKINVPLTIASNTVLNVASGTTLKISDPVTVNAGKTLTQSGTGTVSYESTITVLGGGSVAFSSPSHAAALSLASGATASITTHTPGAGPTILQVDGLSFTDNTSRLNLTNNELITNTSASTMRANIITGKVYSTATGGGVGYLDIGGGKTEARFTLLGDTNLDGHVDVTDLGNLASSYGATSGAQWVQGDTNYDNAVDVTDLGNLASNYGGTLPAAPAGLTAQSLATVASGASAVPEPASLGVLALAGLGSLIRRRRDAR